MKIISVPGKRYKKGRPLTGECQEKNPDTPFNGKRAVNTVVDLG